MAASGHIGIALALGFALIATPALADPISLPATEAKIDASIARWEASARDLERTRHEQSTLEHRIAALKSLEASRAVQSNAELEALLKSSLTADEWLQRQLKKEAELRRSAGDDIKQAIQAIDAEMRPLVPALKTGTIDSRTQAARRIALLKQTRDGLRTRLARLKDPGQSPKSWAKYDVPIAPLDGPTELKEKADLVEDTREKLQRKRAALTKLIEDARADQQLAQAARDFATDVTLFDEESRSGRVQRKGAATLAVNGRQESTTVVTDQARAPTEPGQSLADPQPVAAPPTDRGGADNAFEATGTPPAVPTAPAAKVTSPAATAIQPTTAPAVTGAPISKDVNASVLLSLRIEDLAAQGVDVATLERLIAELKQLDGHLADQAGQIRALAKQLEADEAKVLGKH